MRGEFGKNIQAGVSATRWLLAPMYLGLALLLFVLLILFIRDFFNSLPLLFQMQSLPAASLILSMASVVIIANVVLMILQTGFELFGPETRDDTVASEGRGRVDFARLGTRFIGAAFLVSLMFLLRGLVDAMVAGDTVRRADLFLVGGVLAGLAGLMLVRAVADWFVSLSRSRDG